MHSFFFRELQLITVLFLIRNFYTSWSTRFIPLKLCVGFSNFDSIVVFIKVYIFIQQKNMYSLILKRHNSFQNKNNTKATHSFSPRHLIFK